MTGISGLEVVRKLADRLCRISHISHISLIVQMIECLMWGQIEPTGNGCGGRGLGKDGEEGEGGGLHRPSLGTLGSSANEAVVT